MTFSSSIGWLEDILNSVHVIGYRRSGSRYSLRVEEDLARLGSEDCLDKEISLDHLPSNQREP